MSILRYYRSPGLSQARTEALLASLRPHLPALRGLATEVCFYVASHRELAAEERRILTWLLRETFIPDGLGEQTFLEGDVVEVGPRLSFSTAWSTNAVAICRACGLDSITRIERSRRFGLTTSSPLTADDRAAFLARVHDRMTECHYPEPLASFESGVQAEASFDVPVLEEGRAALERLNREMGLAFDDWDLDYYHHLFKNRIGRNPSNVECFDIAQSNSEHSRHWFFKGRLIIDGQEAPEDLIATVQAPWRKNPGNSVIAFHDNSSAIRGFSVDTILPSRVGEPSPFAAARVDHHILFTAETHNFPSGVAPFPGAETGTGGRIRDVHATGRGALVVAGTAAYCVGNLRIPGYSLPWEDQSFAYPSNLAAPLTIEIEASNGASDYGNKFGEPVICGYTRSFGLRLANGERREWLKPIMFSGGIGQLDARHVDKGAPEPEMWVVKLGGPAYRIGMGGGAASSMVQGDNVAELDFNAVQRGDAEMEQKVNRVIRACVELGAENPIVSIHDQGAGGNCNVLKEIVDPAGARIDIRAVQVGDETLSVLEIWGAEYQENDALLLRPEQEQLFRDLCAREKVPVAFVGRITGDGRVVVQDSRDNSTPVNLELAAVLGDMPQKTFEFQRAAPSLSPLDLPNGETVATALDRVLRLLSVGSKRFLTTKVDRSVTGLVAQQPCAGPLHLTVADVAVIAQSHFGVSGAATAIGEQPIKGLLDPAAMARMSLGEALTNLVWAPVTARADIRCSGNWMWAAKLPGEGAALYDAAVALRDMMLELDVAVDGGKDSLSMAARAPSDGGDETVKAPGSLVLSAYVTCPDIRGTVTPDLDGAGNRLLFVDLGNGRHRMGGSALAHVFGQIGDDCPDADPALLARAFDVTQELIADGRILAGHDRSDGGLLTALLEMAFAGNRGVDIAVPGDDPLALLFNEELGLLLEVAPDSEETVRAAYQNRGVPCMPLGETLSGPEVRVQVGDDLVLDADVRDLRDRWEETSFELDNLQAAPDCVAEERASLHSRTGPSYRLTFEPQPTSEVLLDGDKPRVAILREEGSNGDREMTSAFFAAGFEPWDVTMSDLAAGRVTLDRFRGVVAVGGFSYADVLDSAKGWAGLVRFNPTVSEQLAAFYARSDTFSLGVCNGCQLLALLGWIPWPGIADADQPRFVENRSGRFESRFSSVRIDASPSIMLRGMAGSVLGVWVAHGEGRAHFPSQEILARVSAKGLVPLRYVDERGEVTEAYPDNPNGSIQGIAGLSSEDGRHLALMPHPERAFLTWQWPWLPPEMRSLPASPWLRMFQNARAWCQGPTGS